MDFVLAFSLMLALTSSHEMTSDSCNKTCPPGSHLVGQCSAPAAQFQCKKCGDNEYMDLNNRRQACLRCKSCDHGQVITEPCTPQKNAVCVCKEKYFNSVSDGDIECKECSCAHCGNMYNNPDYRKKCQPCQSKDCLKNPDCRRKCEDVSAAAPAATTPSPPKSTTRAVTETTTSAARATASNSSSNPDVERAPRTPENHMVWMFLVPVTFLVLLWLLLLFTRNTLRFSDSCPCWRANKDLELPAEDPEFDEERRHRGSSPSTLKLNISEDTPRPSPSMAEQPAHITPLLPDSDHIAVRCQDDQSDHWPAIVLYAIIKEVPLRRWKEFLRLLSVSDQQMDRVELEAGLGLGSMERQYQMLRLWSQRSSASLNDVFSALHYMELSGCAQLLQESLDKLQVVTACRSYTDRGLNGALPDT